MLSGQSAASKHINGMLSEREKCGRKKSTSNKDEGSLKRLAYKSRFKKSVELYKKWTKAGVSA